MSKIRPSGPAIILLGFLLLLPNVALAATPVKVLGTTRNEIDPSAESGHLAYGLGRVSNPNFFDVF